MKRRDFLLKGTLGAVGLTLLPDLIWAKDSETNKRILFINSLIDYGREHLEMDLKESFYQGWSEDEDLNYYLYLSHTDRIESPKGVKNYLVFGTDKEAALKQQKEYINQGYHTLLYTRNGKHDHKLTNVLLSYSKEATAFDIYHEATHVHLHKHGKLSPNIEEAACDVMGAFGAKFYAERNEDVSLKKVAKQNSVLEKANKEILKYAALISDDQTENNKVHLKLENKIFKLFSKSDQFFKNRFIHPVNNAYLLMALKYAKHYSLLKDVAIQDKYISTFLYTLESLPKKEEKALEKLKAKLAATPK